MRRSFTASGLLPVESWKALMHSRLKEKLMSDDPLVLSDSDEEPMLEEGGQCGLYSDGESGKYSNSMY